MNTPQTDAHLDEQLKLSHTYSVTPEFARNLERELAGFNSLLLREKAETARLNVQIDKMNQQTREDYSELKKQDEFIARLFAAGNDMKAHLEPRRIGYSIAARETVEAWDKAITKNE